MAALCTGPVTRPSSFPAWQASTAARRAWTTLRALAGSGLPQGGSTGWVTSTRRARPGPLPSSASGRPSAVAARSSAARSPNTVMSAPWSCRSACTHSSGPTPAGSPGTSARPGRSISAVAAGAGADPDVDEGLAAQFAQEAVPLVLELALADALANGVALVLVVHLRLARRDPLYHVPAGLGAERLRHFAVLERPDLVAELRPELFCGEPAQVAAAGAAAGVFGFLGGHLGEVLAGDDTRAQRFGARPGLGVRRRVLAAADQDVARVVLGDRAAGGACLSHVDELQKLEAARAPHRAEHPARLHAGDRGAERGRDLVQPPPAQVTAFQRVGAVGVAYRRGGELHVVAVDQALDSVDLLLCNADLLRGGAVGQRDQDVGQAVLAAAGARAQGGVDFALADHDPALGEPLAQALGHQLLAQRTAEVVERHSVGFHPRAQLVGGHAVLLGDRGDHGVDLAVVDADAAGGRALGLQPHQDQALEHLPLQDRQRRELGLLVGVLGEDVGDRAVEFAAQDHVLVDHGGDLVQGLDLLGVGGAAQQKGGKEGKQEILHGRGSR